MEFSHQKSYLRGSEMVAPSRLFSTIPEMVRLHSKKEKKVAQIYIDWKTFEEECLTYKEMYERGKEFAEGLMELGIRRGDIVALGSENTPCWVWVTLGVQMCGAIPLYFIFNLKDGSDVESLIKFVGDKCKAVIFPSGTNDTNVQIMGNIFQLGHHRGSVVSASLPSVKWSILLSLHHQSTGHFNLQDILQKRKAGIALPNLDPDDTMGIFLTSGTTGTPNLVPFSHTALLTIGHNYAVVLGEGNDVNFNDRPFSWLAGYPSWEIFTGYSRVVIKNVSAIPTMSMYSDVITRILQKGTVNTAMLVTPVLQEIFNTGKYDWKIRSVTACGQPVPATLASLIGKICERFSSFYGCTEVGGISCKVAHSSQEFMDYEVGVPFFGYEVKVVDEKGVLVERGEEGEACVRPLTPFLGYISEKEKTEDVLSNSGWYRTGDSARITQGGSLIVDGRLTDSRVRIGGRFVSVSALECQLKRHPGIRDTVVFSYLDEQHFYCVCCAIIVNDGHNLDKEVIDTFLLDQENRAEMGIFQKLELPRSYVFMETFPRTYNGKINRKKLAEICRETLNVQKT